MASISTYELYKKGTQTIVDWLATTATRCGYVSLEQRKKKKNQNKNKNRKLRAKGVEIGGESKGESSVVLGDCRTDTLPIEPRTKVQPTKNDKISEVRSTTQPSKYTVTTKELSMMATFISEHFEQVSDLEALPGTLEVLRDVIAKRKQYAKFYSRQHANGSSSDEGHEHFVTILEEVQQILGSVMKTLNLRHGQRSDEKAGDVASPSIDERALSNIFAVLEVEDPADVGDDVGEIIVESTKKTQPLTTTTATYQLHEETDGEDVHFKVHCFFKDVVAMRNHIRRSWQDYVSGTLDLATVAVATNVALQILQRAEAELLESTKKLGLTTFEHVFLLLYLCAAWARGIDPLARQQSGDVFNMELEDIADFTSSSVYTILSSFLEELGPMTNPVLEPGSLGELDVSGRPLSWRDQFQQDRIILLELLPEFCIMNNLSQPPPVVDELTRGLIEMVKTHEIPIWLVLGCQLYLDIHHVMILHPMGNMGMAHQELQKMGLYATQTVQSYVKFSERMSTETWPKQNDQAIQSIKTEIEVWINRDFYFPAQKQVYKGIKLPLSSIRPYSLFSRHPLLCGLMLFRMNMNLEEVGIALVNAWNSLPSILHLYNAVKHESLNASLPPWEDLEAVINIHSKERIFIGDYPDSPDQYLKRFCLVMGWSASMLASHRREGRNSQQAETPASKRGPRQMTATSKTTDIFSPQYCYGAVSSDVTFHRIQTHLSTSSNKGQCASPFLPVPFISALQNMIQADILALNIDYLALHRRCIDLLRNVENSLQLDFVKILQKPNYVEKESHLPFLVGHLFKIASGSAKIAGALELNGRNAEGKSRTMLKVAELVEKLVLREGEIEVRRVKEYCRGYGRLN